VVAVVLVGVAVEVPVVMVGVVTVCCLWLSLCSGFRK